MNISFALSTSCFTLSRQRVINSAGSDFNAFVSLTLSSVKYAAVILRKGLSNAGKYIE